MSISGVGISVTTPLVVGTGDILLAQIITTKLGKLECIIFW